MTEAKQQQVAVSEMVEPILMNIISIARFEQEHPYGLHLTAFSVIEKNARAALNALGLEWPESRQISPPTPASDLEATAGRGNETAASGQEIGPTRDAGSEGTP